MVTWAQATYIDSSTAYWRASDETHILGWLEPYDNGWEWDPLIGPPIHTGTADTDAAKRFVEAMLLLEA